MLELKKLSKKELAERLLNYIKELNELEKLISEYIQNKNGNSDSIRLKYKKLKQDIDEEYKYLSKSSNECMDEVSVVHNSYKAGVMEASAKGFTSRSNSKIDQSLFNSVADALYYLEYYLPKSDLEEYANSK
ncbi:hypothetical protein [Lacrimispora celerecrescens]|uniref:Uncharacterized protein n=1 Tax=Lacrimispora celerecrescens TaxID=29354 RepID=A0A084JME2_9FIRM|nr:hypothetical protein [Lacrimispora celerecrescens]KEZ90126.1 hypothetical protein IO98_11615 [Lacrimispora celerecrescens]